MQLSSYKDNGQFVCLTVFLGRNSDSMSGVVDFVYTSQFFAFDLPNPQSACKFAQTVKKSFEEDSSLEI